MGMIVAVFGGIAALGGFFYLLGVLILASPMLVTDNRTVHAILSFILFVLVSGPIFVIVDRIENADIRRELSARKSGR
jgi:hypothetical protein